MLLKRTDLNLRGRNDKDNEKDFLIRGDNSNNWLPFEVMCSPSLEVGLPESEFQLGNL